MCRYVVYRWYLWKHPRFEKAVPVPASRDNQDPLRGMTVIPYLKVRFFDRILCYIPLSQVLLVSNFYFISTKPEDMLCYCWC